MPLHLHVKAGETVVINGAVFQNAKSRTADFTVLNQARVLRGSELVDGATARTPAGEICLALQTIHLSADPRAAITDLYDLGMALLCRVPEAAPLLKAIEVALGDGNTYGALRAGRDLLQLEAARG